MTEDEFLDLQDGDMVRYIGGCAGETIFDLQGNYEIHGTRNSRRYIKINDNDIFYLCIEVEFPQAYRYFEKVKVFDWSEIEGILYERI